MDAQTALDARRIKEDFPILARRVHGKPLVYLDNAATSQKPESVIRAIDNYYRMHNSNVHRSVHLLAEESSVAYEEARAKVARFVNARRPEEIVFTKGTTEAINLVARGWAMPRLQPGDEIVVTEIEHHSNLVPWHMVAKATGARLRHIPFDDQGLPQMEGLREIINPRTRLVAITHASNVLGTVMPVAEIVAAAKAQGALVLLDGAQSVPHLPVDVQALDIDFLAFSGHKMLGPTAIGALWARYELLEEMEPVDGGGSMIRRVTLTESTYMDPPARFEAGTPPIAQAIGLGAAVDYLTALGMEKVARHEGELTRLAYERLAAVDDIILYGPPPDRRVGVISFNLPEVHPHDLASLVDQEGVAIRAGHHCCMPLHDKLGAAATARASFYIYNTPEDVDALIHALQTARQVFRP